jgi:DNA helicase-2/ATP-dependent DNA helicase PcrA
MDTKKHLFSSSRFVEQKAYGISQLRDYFSVYTHNFSKDFLLEKKIITDISGALVSGRFDRINILNPNEVCVIDYKTGSTNRAKTEIAKPSEKNPLGGDYWRQMAFYALLVENTPGQHWQFHSGVFEFLEKNEEKNDIVKFVLHITEEEKEMIRNLILEVSEKIQNQEFSFGCNDEDCEWCRL